MFRLAKKVVGSTHGGILSTPLHDLLSGPTGQSAPEIQWAGSEETLTYQSKSIVVFGQLLNFITRSLTAGLPIQIVLNEIQTQFAAETVVLTIDGRSGASQVLTNSASAAFSDTNEPYERAATIGAMMESHRHVTATEQSADNQVKYTLTVFRDYEAKIFDNEETALAGVLIAQIMQALELASRIESGEVESAVYSEALERMNVGVILVDERGRVSSHTPVAERLLKGREGIQVQGSTLRAVKASEDSELQAAIREAAQVGSDGRDASEGCGLSLSRPSHERPLGIIVQPARMRSTGKEMVTVFVRDCQNEPNLNEALVRRVFNLTPAEADVTVRLTAGLSLEDAAKSLEISRNTARAHLRSIFAKNGITRQTDLVRLMLNSAVALGERPEPPADQDIKQFESLASSDDFAGSRPGFIPASELDCRALQHHGA